MKSLLFKLILSLFYVQIVLTSYAYITFTSSGSFVVTSTTTYYVLIVAGGGGGGCGTGGDRESGGGGAAGGVGYGVLTLTAGTYSITVGTGGAGGKSSAWSGIDTGCGSQGQDSKIIGGSINEIAYGGGYGGSACSYGASGGSGGGGGGGCLRYGAGSATTGIGSLKYLGYSGTIGTTYGPGGGGGGSGSVSTAYGGANVNGGSGYTWINYVTYAGGGGGGQTGSYYGGTTIGVGGSSVGGNGGTSSSANGGDGYLYTGSGGGGGYGNSGNGGSGSSGIVIFAYNMSSPTSQPSRQPSSQPSRQPSSQPSIQPTSQPSRQPSSQPSSQPTVKPTIEPTAQPSLQPSSQPSSQPTVKPTIEPTAQPSSQPSSQPTVKPTIEPTAQPSSQPSSQPTVKPTIEPTAQPSRQPTAQPSSLPTGQPTGRPTILPSSILLANPFETPLSSGYVKVKLNFYLGPYVLYFFIWFMLLISLDIFGVYKSVVNTLLRSSFESEVYIPTNNITKNMSDPLFLRLLKTYNESLLTKKNEYVKDLDGLLDSHREKNVGTSVDQVNSAHVYEYDTQKLRIFYDYLVQCRTYLGCSGTMVASSCLFFNLNVQFDVARMEDFILFILNNHNILSCSFCAKGSSFSRHGRRISWLVQHSIGFVMVAFTESIMSLLGLPVYMKPLCDSFVIRPVTIALTTVLRIIYINSIFSDCFVLITSILLIASTFILLVIAAVFTPPGASKTYLILRYFLVVHVLSFIVEILNAYLLFQTSYHLSVYIGRWRFISIGNLFCEIIVKRQLVEGIDFAHHQYAFACFSTEYIFPLNYDKLIESKNNIEASNAEVNNTTNTFSTSYRDSAILVNQTNPLLLRKIELEKEKVNDTNIEIDKNNLEMSDVNTLMSNEKAFLSKSPAAPYVAPTFNPILQIDDENTVNIHTMGMSEACDEPENMTETAMRLKKFRPEIKKEYKTLYHFFQAREKGYINATAIEQIDMDSISRNADRDIDDSNFPDKD